MAVWFKTTFGKLVNLDDFVDFDIVAGDAVLSEGKCRWFVVGNYDVGDIRNPAKLLGPYTSEEEASEGGLEILLNRLQARGGK